MVDRNQLGMLNSLNQRAAQIQSWLNVIKREPKITAMTLTVTEQVETDEETGETGGGSSVTIPTSDIATPPQMMAAIQAQLESNYQELVKRMTELGVSTSVVAQAQPQPHSPQPEHTPPPPKPQPAQAPKPTPKPTSHRR